MNESSETGTAVTLIIVRGGEEIQRRSFDADVIRIGRSDQNTLVVSDSKASRFHCRILRRGDVRVVEDAGSRNGTRLNNRRIVRKTLSAGDAIQVGDTSIFIDAVPARPAVPPGPRTAADGVDGDVMEPDQTDRLLRERANLLRIAEVNKALNSEADLHRLMEIIIDAVIELTSAERGFIFTFRDGAMEFEVARNFMEAAVEQPELAVSRSIASEAARDCKPVISVNAREDDRFRAVQSISNLGLRSVLCVPLVRMGEAAGAVYVDNRLNKGVFTEDDLRLIEAFADQASIALENARRMAELKHKNQELRRVERELARTNRGLAQTVRSQSTELQKARARLASSGRAKGIRYHYGAIVGSSEAMTKVIALLERVIDSEFSVLVQGESGTGKDLVAEAIHFNSRRASMPFVSENCAALPESLLESELFGHEKGAFTGAIAGRKGLLELAHGGTLFLDEVGDMSPAMQTKLLRFLQDGEFRPVGAADTVRVNVRIISASNRNLSNLVEEGLFRQDLYFRLNVLPVNLPPLRERREDIPHLAVHFLELLCGEMGREPPEIDPEVIDLFSRYSWPGNVRDLENEMRRLLTLSSGRIGVDLVSERIRNGPDRELALADLGGLDLTEKIETIERHEISAALRACRGNKSRAARRLGISRFTLQRKIDKYNLGKEATP